MLQLGVDIDHSDEEGFTALHHAALSGFEDVVKVLREAGADVNSQSLDYGTPLHLAALKGRDNVVDLLLEYRANPNATSGLLGSPLHCACGARGVSIASTLLSAGAQSRACRIISERVFTSVIRPSPGQIQDFYLECEPLHLAACFHSADLVDLLLKKDALANARCRQWGSDDRADISFDNANNSYAYSQITPLMLAASSEQNSACRALLRAGADPDLQDDTGSTPLLEAVSHGHAQLVKLLLEHGADLYLRDKDNRTALSRSAHFGHSGCIRILSKAGCRMDSENAEDAMLLAAGSGHLEAVRALAEEGVNFDYLGEGGRTPCVMPSLKATYRLCVFSYSWGRIQM